MRNLIVGILVVAAVAALIVLVVMFVNDPKTNRDVHQAGQDAKELGHDVKEGVKEGAEKVDCVVDALRSLELPDPGSYAVKVQFLL